MPEFTRGEWEDIGDGNRIRRVYCDGKLDALDWQHGCASPCDDFIPLNNTSRFNQARKNSWEIQSENPLTISPSLLCTDPRCNRHGFIREGRWIPA